MQSCPIELQWTPLRFESNLSINSQISDLRNTEALQIDRVCSILKEPRTQGEVLIPKLKRLCRNVYIIQSYNVR